MAHAEKCPVCGGKGTKSEPCKTCGDTEWVDDTIRSVRAGVDINRPCPGCKGTGKLLSDNPCHGCSGKGWVEVGDDSNLPMTIDPMPWPYQPFWYWPNPTYPYVTWTSTNTGGFNKPE